MTLVATVLNLNWQNFQIVVHYPLESSHCMSQIDTHPTHVQACFKSCLYTSDKDRSISCHTCTLMRSENCCPHIWIILTFHLKPVQAKWRIKWIVCGWGGGGGGPSKNSKLTFRERYQMLAETINWSRCFCHSVINVGSFSFCAITVLLYCQLCNAVWKTLV